jgi:uncharacterized damage-inducible protein DinB
MSILVEQMQRLIAYNQWADERLITAAGGLSAEQYSALRDQFAHMLGTMLWWNARWRGRSVSFPDMVATTTAAVADRATLRAAYAAAHNDFTEFGAAITDQSWQRAEQWWIDWGIDAVLPVGEVITQVVNHGTQHRSEIAAVTSLHGCSPGDLDYLTYRVPEQSG